MLEPRRKVALLFLLLPIIVVLPWQEAGIFPVSVLAATATQSPDNGDWPMYGHDPARTNFNPAETTLGASNVNNLVQRWQSPDLGSNGAATSGAPSIYNGKVYVGSSAPTGPNFFAFDAATGKQLWSMNIGYQAACFSVGIGSTSAISGTVLVVGGGDDAYYGLNADTGARLWRNAMNVGASGYPWSSPLLADGRAYVGIASGCDNPSVRGEVRAINLDDGSPIASQYFVPEGQAGAGIWNSPALSPDGNSLLVATGEDFAGYNGPYNRAVVSLDPFTLAIREAHQQGTTDEDADFGTTPVVFHDNLGRTLVGANHKGGIFYTYAVGSINGGPIWSRPTGVRIGTMPAYDPTFGNGGTLFIQGADNHLFAVNPATGNDRWQSVPGDGRGNLAIANGLIYLNENGTLRIIDEADGHTFRTIIPDNAGDSNSGVAVSHGLVYWLSGSHLNVWGLADGAEATAGPKPTDTTVAVATPPAPGNKSELFPETGKTLAGLFLDYWQADGGIPQQGYPISDVMIETSDLDGKAYAVQYFERSVFEYHANNLPPYNVLLSQLGTFQYEAKYPKGAPNQQPNNNTGSVLFKETGKRLGGKFLEYWNAHGGLAQQGFPISDEFVEKSDLNGKPYLVQYFERAVFELHPENAPPYDVLLSQLGRLRYKARHAK